MESFYVNKPRISREIDLAFGRLTFLSDDEVLQIHEISLKVLQEVGIRVTSKAVQNVLAESGAEVDASRSIAKIPSSLVAKAVKTAPKE